LATEKVSPENLQTAIDQAEPGSLLMSMIHTTGDLALLDEFEAMLAAAREARYIDAEAARTHYGATSGAAAPPPGQFPPEMIAEVRARAREVLTTDLTPALGVPDAELFRRMASLCTADTVTDEFIPLLLEQSGFELSRRRVPVTKAPPPTSTSS